MLRLVPKNQIKFEISRKRKISAKPQSKTARLQVFCVSLPKNFRFL